VKTALACILFTVACADTATPDDDSIDVIVGDGKADTSANIHLASGKTSTVKFTATGDPLDISVDCHAPADPDSVGAQFTVTFDGTSPTNAALWQWTGAVDAGAQSLKIRGKGGSATCRVQVSTATGSCTDASVTRSPVTDHTHLSVGTTPASGDFPASGNHWGAWAKWDSVYTRPVKRGFLLHNLEHGGIVLSYGCKSASDSADCADAAKNLEALKEAFGEARVIVTPDPQQTTLYGARAWRTAFSSSCYDRERMLGFMNDHFRNGREDLDENPPIAYDPTTENVPCEDLMAAPDSCN
jgi:hypothetical protein